jgi:hypothetical protein
MKQKDIALIVLAVGVSSIISYFVANTFIASPKNRTAKVEVVEKISSEFTRPSEKYFNGNSVNPTKTIIIGQDGNPTPFNAPK